jgi:hypothetical protein
MALYLRRHVVALALIGLVVLLAGCGDGMDAATPGATPAAPAETSTGTAAPPSGAQSTFDFPTGPAVLVERGYEPPGDRVPSTGAYLPANGKPTLVYVDAIW